MNTCPAAVSWGIWPPSGTYTYNSRTVNAEPSRSFHGDWAKKIALESKALFTRENIFAISLYCKSTATYLCSYSTNSKENTALGLSPAN